MDIKLFDYELPEALIAQQPVANRSQSRLLNVSDKLEDLQFGNLIDLLNPGDLLITNNTKVMRARVFGKKSTGGKVELMLERIIDNASALAQIKSNKSISVGTRIIIDAAVNAFVSKRANGFFIVNFTGAALSEILREHGQIPLPPYIKRRADAVDDARYQTVYAKKTGAVAAPTAGLHFDHDLLHKIEAKGVNRCELTLHVGAGTFQPVRVADIEQHKMHNEYYEIDDAVISAVRAARNSGGRIIGVGTTTLRALESAYLKNRLESEISTYTDLFIYPGFKFNVVDALVTNFHLPRSTLLMLVSAFSGYEAVMRAYQHAIEFKYRFFSYGDAMFLNRKKDDDQPVRSS